MTEAAEIAELRAAHERFLALVGHLRPDLHRYCARMCGSVVDGEDVVQDTLARAYFELSQLRELPALRSWLFRIAHRIAIDHARRRRRGPAPVAGEDDVEFAADDDANDAEEALAQSEAVGIAIARFAPLPASQRAAVVLKDVLGESLEEIAEMLETTVPAVKAALHRGRATLAATRGEPGPEARAPNPTLVRYAALFNARDWDGVRAMLVDDVRLDVVTRDRRRGLEQVGKYFTNYARIGRFHLTPAVLDGRDVLAVREAAEDAAAVYVVELELDGERVRFIRDFRYVPYILADARFDD